MPTSGGAQIPITASRKQIFREIKPLMGNGGRQAPFLIACKLEPDRSTTGLLLTTRGPDALFGSLELKPLNMIVLRTMSLPHINLESKCYLDGVWGSLFPVVTIESLNPLMKSFIMQCFRQWEMNQFLGNIQIYVFLLICRTLVTFILIVILQQTNTKSTYIYTE